MTSHTVRGSSGSASVNTNAIEPSITEQSVVNGDTPATLSGRPTSPGLPPNTASMCGVAPGSWSVIVTSNGAYSSATHATVADQVSSSTSQPSISVGSATTDDTWRTESLSPGRRIAPS